MCIVKPTLTCLSIENLTISSVAE